MSTNMAFIVGVVHSDPELKQIGQAKYPFLRLSIYTIDSQENLAGQVIPEADWHSVNLYGDLAVKIAEQVQKDSTVSIVGTLKNRNFESGGRLYHISEMRAEQAEVVSNRKNSGAFSIESPLSEEQMNELLANDFDIPF